MSHPGVGCGLGALVCGMTIRARVLKALEELGGDWELMEIDPALSDTAAFCEAYSIPLDQSVNSILISTKKEPMRDCLCSVLASTKLDVNKRVKRLMEAKVSFSARERMTDVTGMEFGAVTPVGLPESIPVYLDSRIMAAPWVILGGGERSLKIKIAPEALSRLPNIEVVEDLGIGP